MVWVSEVQRIASTVKPYEKTDRHKEVTKIVLFIRPLST